MKRTIQIRALRLIGALSVAVLASSCGGGGDNFEDYTCETLPKEFTDIPVPGKYKSLDDAVNTCKRQTGKDCTCKLAGGASGATGGSGSSGSTSALLSNVTAVAVGGVACAVLKDRTAKCWGRNDHGEVGDASNSRRLVPTAVADLTGVMSIAAGSDHTCALISDGTVRCWGDNTYGQLGNVAVQGASNKPVQVGDVTGAKALSAYGRETCALLAEGRVKCWPSRGKDGKSQPVPEQVSGIANAVAVSVGAATCAILSDKTLNCWSGANSPAPSDVKDVTAVTAGNATCVIVAGGKVKCWGQAAYGALGNDDHSAGPPPVKTPVEVLGIENAIALGGSGSHTVVLLSDGTLKQWGSGGGGANQTGSCTPQCSVAQQLGPSGPVEVISGATAIAVGGMSCALLADGTVRCWGSGGYYLGDGTSKQHNYAVAVVSE